MLVIIISSDTLGMT